MKQRASIRGAVSTVGLSNADNLPHPFDGIRYSVASPTLRLFMAQPGGSPATAAGQMASFDTRPMAHRGGTILPTCCFR